MCVLALGQDVLSRLAGCRESIDLQCKYLVTTYERGWAKSEAQG